MFVIIVIRGGVPADNEIRGILEGDQHHIQRTGRDPGRIRPGRMNGMRPKRWQEYHPEERAIHRLVPSAVWAYNDCFTSPQVDDDDDVGINASSYST